MVNQQAGCVRCAPCDRSLPFAPHNAGANFRLCDMGYDHRISGTVSGKRTQPLCTRLDDIAFYQGAAIHEIMAHGPLRRSSMIVSESGGCP
jgi:hypothetical protein